MTDQKVSGTKRVRGDRKNLKLSVRRIDGRVELCIPSGLIRNDLEEGIKVVDIQEPWLLAKELVVVE